MVKDQEPPFARSASEPDYNERRRDRRPLRNTPIPMPTITHVEGSGTGKVTPWKARNMGSYKPEANVLLLPLGVNSRMLEPLVAKRLPVLLKANPQGPFNPEAKVLLPPFGVNS